MHYLGRNFVQEEKFISICVCVCISVSNEYRIITRNVIQSLSCQQATADMGLHTGMMNSAIVHQAWRCFKVAA